MLAPCDTAGTLQGVIGFSLLVNRYTGVRYDEKGFTPYWESFIEHNGWFELVCVLSDDGYGCVALIPGNTEDRDLLTMCHSHARQE